MRLNAFSRGAFTACFLLLYAAGGADAQTLLRGVVRDRGSGETLPMANVSLPHHKGNSRVLGGAADWNGRYSFSVPATDTATVRCQFVGYATVDTLVYLKGKNVVALDFFLLPPVLETVEIVDEGRRTNSFTRLEKINAQHMTGPAGGIEAMLKTLPDVNSNNEMSSQYSVRGGSFDENLVYINGVEAYRPILVRSGQQEGLSIVNPDLVDRVNFSPGGFDVSYGDKMSSVLDVSYLRLVEHFGGTASVSPLGANVAVRGNTGNMYYATGLRLRSNQYLFRSLDTKGTYHTHYTDLQVLAGYTLNEKFSVDVLGLLTRNVYGISPDSQATTFGGFFQTLELDVYFDGQERDQYRTALGAVAFNYHPHPNWWTKWTTSLQCNNESEIYDVQSQYWLYELNVGAVDTGDQRVDRGVGSYLEHARNHMRTQIFSSELSALTYGKHSTWKMGLKLQHERVDDRVREWKWVDSAGFSFPFVHHQAGVDDTVPESPVLQNFCAAHNMLSHTRLMGYAMREQNFRTQNGDFVNVTAGLRAQLYGLSADTSLPAGYESISHRLLVSPRASASLRPRTNKNILLRLAAGLYIQPPFYREYRHDDGSLNLNLRPQNSYQATGTLDWDLKIWDRPFRLTTDIYYKYITHLTPYRIENLRMRYDANNDAVAYAVGLSVRLNGQFVPGAESWASLSLMQTREDLLGDTLGWLARPTDQRISFKVFFQDYVPRVPFWKMSLNFVAASGLPANSPFSGHTERIFRLKPYVRVDWGNSIELTKFDRIRNWMPLRNIAAVWLSLDVFNLLDYDNEVSYIWISDYNSLYYPVPNKLTGRQVSLKLTIDF
ncbi:MAG: carboxypeptidase-like regulatory domain-containing protein [Bacteroidales bacterium]|nr:carboxypeptidase-like regulatory domain-containing protein [Bacteroidales bacterium]